MKLKFLFPLLGFASGILLSDCISHSFWIGGIAISFALIIWIILTLFSKDPTRGRSISYLHTAWIFLIFLGIGSIDYDLNSRIRLDQDIENQKCLITGEIYDIKFQADGDRFNIKVISIKDTTGRELKSDNLNILLKTDGYMGVKGDIISFLSTPRKFQNSYRKKMLHQGIAYSCNVKSDEITKTGYHLSINNYFQEIRDYFIIKLEKSSLNRSTSEFIISILLGDKSLLSTDVRQTLTSAGMAHILALSGMHVAIVLAFFMFLLFPLSFFHLRKTRQLVALALIWIYVAVTGCNPSTVRVAIMASFVVLAFVTERKHSALNGLLAAVLIILFFNPLDLWNIGLQLSFMCVASILIFTSRLNPVEQSSHPKLHAAINAILITIITTLSTWILVAYYFGNVPLLFLPSNLLLLPFLPLFVSLALIYTILLGMGFDLNILAYTLDFYLKYFIGSADLLSLNGNSSFNIHVPFASLIIWIIALAFLVGAFNLKNTVIKKSSYILTVVLLGFSVMLILNQPYDSQSLKFLNNFSSIETHYKENGNITKLEFPRYNISQVANDRFKITSIDQPIHRDSLKNFKVSNNVNHFLIIGGNADVNQMADLIRDSNYSKIILHSGVSNKKKTEILRLVDESFYENIYSLRENGSLEFEF